MLLEAGQCAVITGAGDGIGKAMAFAFAAEGLNLHLLDIDRSRVEAVADEARPIALASGATDVLGSVVDVTDRNALFTMADESYERFGNVHVLCNNAGIVGTLQSPLLDIDADAFRWVMEVNVLGVLNGTQAYLPRMIEGAQPGHIVNTASVAGLASGVGGGAYTASKHAVIAMTRSLRAEMQGTPIGVSALCPSFVNTNLVRNTLNLASGDQAGKLDEAALNAFGEVLHSGGIDVADVASMVVDSVKNNRFYIITHAGTVAGLDTTTWQQLRDDEADLHR